MTRQSFKLFFLAPLAAGALPITAAQAQYYSSVAQPAPLYPYAVQNSNGVQTSRPYAIEVAPNVYEIKRPAATRDYPYVRGGGQAAKPVRAPKATKEAKAPRFDRPLKPADHTLIEELRKRTPVKRTVINTTKIVRDAPVVIETQRVVDDPPRVIERYHVVEDEPVRPRRKPAVAEREPEKPASGKDDKVRIIRAEAEVTILGPDRMSIRLFRKGQGGSKANARAE